MQGRQEISTKKESIKKIAIVRRNGLGDLLCAMPLVHHCRKLMPEASITLFVDARCAPLLPYLQGYDEAIVFHKRIINRYIGALWTALKHRNRQFDLVVSAKTVPMKLINFILWTLNGDQRMAVVDESWHSCFINCKVPQNVVSDFSVHQAVSSLRILSPEINAIPLEYHPRLVISQQVAPPPCIARLKLFQRDVAKDSEVPLLMISVTNNREASFLGLEGYEAILNKIAHTKKFQVVVSCEEKDNELAEKLIKKLKMPAIVISTKTLDEFLHLLNAVDVIFVGDGGIMHMAAALNKRQLVLFGSTRLEQWRPLSSQAICLHHPTDVKNIDQGSILQALSTLL